MKTDELDLREQTCEDCSVVKSPLQGRDLQKYYAKLRGKWELMDDHHLEKTFSFKNFNHGMGFTLRIGKMSEKEGHHPEIYLKYREVKLLVYTQAIDALSENDFIWAAKAEEIYEKFAHEKLSNQK